jgi:hypothetical protein
MPSLSQHKSKRFVKLLLLGDAKSGKTGSLISLVHAGYKLRILDFDNLLDILAKLVEEQCPERAENVEYRTLRDRRIASPAGPIIDGSPTAFVQGIKMLDRWKYKGSEGEIDLGVPSRWGPESILVIDSLSRLCDAAYDFREPLAVRGKSGEFDPRAVYGDAQDAIEALLATLTGDTFETNVIVICHGQYMDLPDGKKMFPQGVGQKLSPRIPQYFPNYVRVNNMAGKRTIQLQSDALIDLAVSNPTGLSKTLPADTGLATLFEHLRGKFEPLKEIEYDGNASAIPDPRPAQGLVVVQPIKQLPRR